MGRREWRWEPIQRVRPLLLPQKPPIGRMRHNHRTILGGILWVLRRATLWSGIPTRFGTWDMAYARHRR